MVFQKGDLVLAVRRPMIMTQNQRQILTQMGMTVHNRNNLLKWSIPPYNPRRRYTHDADERQILEEVLSLTGSFL